jgi:hypothetical protein
MAYMGGNENDDLDGYEAFAVSDKGVFWTLNIVGIWKWIGMFAQRAMPPGRFRY